MASGITSDGVDVSIGRDESRPPAKRARTLACDGCKLNVRWTNAAALTPGQKTRCVRSIEGEACDRCRTRTLLCSLLPVNGPPPEEPALHHTLDTAADRTLDDALRGFLRTAAIMALRSGMHIDQVDDEDDAMGFPDATDSVHSVIARMINAFDPAPVAAPRPLSATQEFEALRVVSDQLVPLLGWPADRVPCLRTACPSLLKAALAVGSRAKVNEASAAALYRKALEATTAVVIESSSLAVCLAIQLLATWPAPRTLPTPVLSGMGMSVACDRAEPAAVVAAISLGLETSSDESDRQIYLSVYLCDAMCYWLVANELIRQDAHRQYHGRDADERDDRPVQLGRQLPTRAPAGRAALARGL